MTRDEMVEWHYQLNGHEFEQTPGDSEGQGSLACYSPWDRQVRYNLASEQLQQEEVLGPPLEASADPVPSSLKASLQSVLLLTLLLPTLVGSFKKGTSSRSLSSSLSLSLSVSLSLLNTHLHTHTYVTSGA